MALSVEENEVFTRVGPGTPAGEMLRRYWHPIGFAKELRGRPKRRRVLGEDLVLFRDDRGRLGLLGLRCPHRGTSLEYGHIEDGGFAAVTMAGSSMSAAAAWSSPPNPPRATSRIASATKPTAWRSWRG